MSRHPPPRRPGPRLDLLGWHLGRRAGGSDGGRRTEVLPGPAPNAAHLAAPGLPRVTSQRRHQFPWEGWGGRLAVESRRLPPPPRQSGGDLGQMPHLPGPLSPLWLKAASTERSPLLVSKAQNQSIVRPHPLATPARAKKLAGWSPACRWGNGRRDAAGGAGHWRHLLDGDGVDSLPLEYSKVRG